MNWATELRKQKPMPMHSFGAPNDIWLAAADRAARNHISVSHVLREALKAYAATGKLATEK